MAHYDYNTGTIVVDDADIQKQNGVVQPVQNSSTVQGAQQPVQATNTAQAAQATQQPTRMEQLQKDADAARGVYENRYNEVNNIRRGNVNGLADIMAQYGPKETPEQTESRKRRERVATDAMAWMNILNGVANVVTASGTNGRSVKPMDSVKPYMEGINTAEAKRKENEVAREKARQAYIDKELSRANMDLTLASNDYNRAVGRVDAENKIQADKDKQARQFAMDAMKIQAANGRAAAQIASKEKMDAANRGIKQQSVNNAKRANDIRERALELKANGSSGSKNSVNVVYGKNASESVDLPNNKWKNSPENIKKALNLIYDENKTKEQNTELTNFISSELEKYGVESVEKLKIDQKRELVQDYMSKYGKDSKVTKFVRTLGDQDPSKDEKPNLLGEIDNILNGGGDNSYDSWILGDNEE